jgi:hypothetical protein
MRVPYYEAKKNCFSSRIGPPMVLPNWLRLRSIRLGEDCTLCIEVSITDELEYCVKELVGSRTCDDIDRASGAGDIPRSVDACDYLELLGRVGVWERGADERKRLDGYCTIEREVGSAGAYAVSGGHDRSGRVTTGKCDLIGGRKLPCAGVLTCVRYAADGKR